MIILFTEHDTSGQFVLNIVLLTYGHKQSEHQLCTVRHDSNSQGYIQLLTSTICHYKQQTFALFLVLFEVHIPSNTRMTAQQLKYNARGQSLTATIACFFFHYVKQLLFCILTFYIVLTPTMCNRISQHIIIICLTSCISHTFCHDKNDT